MTDSVYIVQFHTQVSTRGAEGVFHSKEAAEDVYCRAQEIYMRELEKQKDSDLPIIPFSFEDDFGFKVMLPNLAGVIVMMFEASQNVRRTKTLRDKEDQTAEALGDKSVGINT